MSDSINSLIEEAKAFTPSNKEELEQYRLRFLSKKGVLTDLFAKMKDVAPDQRKEYGRQVNELKIAAEDTLARFKEQFEQLDSTEGPRQDLSLPAYPMESGAHHPLSIVRRQIIGIFERIGFNVSDGPEIEDDWHNFSALNFPPEHPARDMQDTFFIDLDAAQDIYNGSLALRTHTSSIQVRVMEKQAPPIRTICPGRVYRNEAISARAHCFFHQVEGFYIDEGVSFADLKQTLLHFAQEMFGNDTKIRLRPSYFPFTEPSAEMDISCTICKGKGCNVCKYTGWVEILGCGMIDPAVLENGKIDPNKYTGFAFGMGIERITMLKYSIKDLRIFSENDVRFLNQFRGVK
ncbi:MAG: phenylalanine--tRNA ligase subunit alpha [Bacteroidia bacterium]